MQLSAAWDLQVCSKVLINETVKFMANDRNFQQTLESLCMLSPWMTHILVDVSGCDCWTELGMNVYSFVSR